MTNRKIKSDMYKGIYKLGWGRGQTVAGLQPGVKITVMKSGQPY